MSLNVEGQNCPVCKGHLFHDDDIVYCPVCGAPHHRDCYASLGHCALEEFHGTEQQYRRPEPTDQEEKAMLPEEQNNHPMGEYHICQYCGHENSKGALFCGQCGRPLQDQGVNPNKVGGGMEPYIIDPLGGVQQEEKIDGISAVDFARFVMLNTARYIPLFKRLSKQNKTSWNWAAFFFPQGWLFYRKCYKQGFLFLLFSVFASVLMFPTQIFASNIIPPNATTMQQIYDALSAHLGDYTPFMQATFFLSGIVSLGYRIVCGLLGDYIYKSSAVTKIRLLKTTSNYSELLPHVGGVNLLMLLVAFVASYWIPTAISLLI